MLFQEYTDFYATHIMVYFFDFQIVTIKKLVKIIKRNATFFGKHMASNNNNNNIHDNNDVFFVTSN